MRGHFIGMDAADIDTPALCLDIEVVEANIRRMADYFRERPVRLRPHAKTHKCPKLGHSLYHISHIDIAQWSLLPGISVDVK